MKKVIAFTLTLLMILSLAACGGRTHTNDSGSDTSKLDPEPAISLPAASISGQEDEFTKKLVPVTYADGEQVESLYYKSVVDGGEVFYEIQPEGEAEPLRVPVSSAVIYVVSTAEECQVVKTSFDYEVEGSEPARIDQYRIFAMADTGAVVSGANEPAAQEGVDSSGEDGAITSPDGGLSGETEVEDGAQTTP